MPIHARFQRLHRYHVKIAGTKATFPTYLTVSIQVISTLLIMVLKNVLYAAYRSIPVSKSIRGQQLLPLL